MAAFPLILGFSPRLPAQGYTIWSHEGSVPGERLGLAVAGGADLTGDGVPDSIVGGENSAAGIVKVFSGATGSLLFADTGGSNQLLGVSVASLGDLDGDAVADFAASAGFANYTRVYSGASGVLLSTFGGTRVAGVGDVNGDGTPDLLLGNPEASIYLGQARLQSGATGAVLFVLNGTQANGFFGGALDGPGDLDGDGVPDAFVGGPGVSNNLGYARLFSGANGAALFTFNGTAPYDHLGRSVASLGDLNGDGVSDLAAGAPQEGFGPGYARVYSGASGAVLFTVTGTMSGSFGTSVAGPGDVSGDGIPDLLVGAPGVSGASGQARVFSGSNGSLFRTFNGTGGEWFGFSVAGAGDVDGDGVRDMIVGGRYASPNGIDTAGHALVISTAGIPFGSFLFGSGCPGSGGIVPNIRAGGGLPTSTGNPSFGIFLSRSLGGASALLLVGTSFQSWLGTPLPLNLGFVGMPGCSLLVSADIPIPSIASGSGPGNGTAFVPIPVPPSLALAATFLHLQWVVFDPGPGLVPFSMSSGLKLLIL